MVTKGKAVPKDFDRELPTGASTVQAAFREASRGRGRSLRSLRLAGSRWMRLGPGAESPRRLSDGAFRW